jgi:epsilon-lactone hydrolase
MSPSSNALPKKSSIALAFFLALAPALHAQQATGPETNSSVVDAQGTAHITRVVPVPTTISPEAQANLRRPDTGETSSLAERRSSVETWQTGAGKASQAAYPVNIESITIAGVPARNVTPIAPSPHPDCVLINVHGGGFDSDSGSFTESIPIANLTRIRVVSLLYPLAPEHPFPAAVDATVAVYRELLKTYKPQHIGLYGTSAGAILTAEVAVRLKQLHLPLPAALGIFSGLGDFSKTADSQAIFSLRGFTGALPLPSDQPHDPDYVGNVDQKDPVLSPVYADLRGMPPTLFITSTRDLLLSGTTILHRRFLASSDDARLVVFEALPHAFWNDINLPETKEAYGLMSTFFTQQLTR